MRVYLDTHWLESEPQGDLLGRDYGLPFVLIWLDGLSDAKGSFRVFGRVSEITPQVSGATIKKKKRGGRYQGSKPWPPSLLLSLPQQRALENFRGRQRRLSTAHGRSSPAHSELQENRSGSRRSG